MIITRESIEQLEQRYRTAFVNSLAGFRQAVLVGTHGADGSTNVAIFNSLIHLGANPPLFGLINRPDSVPRHTLQNIRESNDYTLNFVRSADVEKAHQTSARYERDVSEFEAVGFNRMLLPGCSAPFVAEAVVRIGMRLEDVIDIPLSGTLLIVGSVTLVDVGASLVGGDGYVALSDADVLISQGLDAYFTSTSIGRLPYAKP